MKKVLILEDEVSIRSFVVINLNRAGYEVIEAGTGMEALEKYSKEEQAEILAAGEKKRAYFKMMNALLDEISG